MSEQLQGTLIKIDEQEVQLQVLKQKIDGTCLLMKEEDAWKVITTSDNAYICCFESPIKKQTNKQQIVIDDYSQLFQLTHLPKSVSLPIGYLEKTVDMLDPSANIGKVIKISASSNLLEGTTNETLFEKLLVDKGKNTIIINPPSASIEITLSDTSNYLLVGLRILADAKPKQSVIVFNRSINLGTIAENVTEIGFCDAEILFAKNGTFKLMFKSDNEPIILKGIELYAFHKDTFKLPEKLGKIDQKLMTRTSDKFSEYKDYTSILSTTTYEILSWEKKEELLGKAFGNNNKLRAFINCLDFLSYTAYTSSSIAEKVAEEIINSLEIFMHLRGNDLQARIIKSASRKCIKAIIYNVTQGSQRIEGDKFHYQTCKCRALFSYLKALMKQTIPLNELEKGLKSLTKAKIKVTLTFFEGIMNNKDVIEWINTTIISSLKNNYNKKSVYRSVVRKYTMIIIGYCDYLLNLELNTKIDSNFKKGSESVNSLLKSFIFSKDEEMAASFITILSELLIKHDKRYVNYPITRKFARDLFKSKEEQVVSIEIHLFDFSHEVALCLCKNIIEYKDSKGRVYIAPFVLLHELFYNYSMRKKIKDDVESWNKLFSTFVNTVITKSNPLDSSNSETILLGLKLINSLFSTNSTSLREETAVDFIASCYRDSALIAWISTSIEKLSIIIKNKKTAIEISQDKQDNVTFLKPKFKRNDWKIFAIASSEETETFHEIIKLCYKFSLHDKEVTSKNLNTILSTYLLVDILKQTLCEFLLNYSEKDFYMKTLFKMLFKTKEELTQYKDNFIYALKLSDLKELVNVSNYESQVNIYRNLNDIWKVAKNRSAHWKTYTENHTEVFNTLFKISGTIYEKTAFQALTLASLGLETEECKKLSIKNTFGILANNYPCTTALINSLMLTFSKCNEVEKKFNVEKIFDKGLAIGNEFILDSASVQMRVASAYLLRGLYDNSNEKEQEMILKKIGEKISSKIHHYGCASLQILSLCLCVFSRIEEPKTNCPKEIIKNIVESAKESLNIIRNHDNAIIYKEVQSLSDNSFLYCLEEVPCHVCISDIAQDYTNQKISDIKQDYAFTSSAFIYKLINSYSIQKITLDLCLLENRKIKEVVVYHSSVKSMQLPELRENWKVWKKAGTVTLKQKTQSTDIEFSVPIITSLLKIEFITGGSKAEE